MPDLLMFAIVSTSMSFKAKKRNKMILTLQSVYFIKPNYKQGKTIIIFQFTLKWKNTQPVYLW